MWIRGVDLPICKWLLQISQNREGGNKKKEKKTREEQRIKTQLLKALSSGQWSDGIRFSLSKFLYKACGDV